MFAHKERIVPGRRTASPYKKLLELERLSPDVRNELVRRILCACTTCVSQLKTASDQSAHALEITMHPMPTSNIGNIGDHAITQKARGLHALRKHPLPGLVAPNAHSTFIASRPVSAQLRESGLAQDACRAFIRPAPSQPWHGFQESKLYDFGRDDQHSHQTVRAECSAALNNTLEQARLLDPYAEVISMAPIEAAYSAVMVLESGVLVIGRSYDGATAGRDSITLLSEPIDRKTLRQAARIRRLEDHAYIEIVYDNPSGSNPPNYVGHAVQCRPGTPIAGGATEFIPAPIVVSEVITPTDDLIAWRELTSKHANQPGLVAWRPGGSLACHAAIHCASNNIPFLTRATRPEFGETISPADTSNRAWEFDSAEFSRGLTSLRGRSDYMQLLSSGIPLFHNLIHLKSDPRWSCWLGTIAASFFRAAAAACFGEMRHIRRYRQGRHARAAMALETTLLEIILSPMDEESLRYLESTYPGEDHHTVRSRPQIYENTAGYSLSEIADKLAAIAHHYLDSVWSKGYGGLNWFRSTVHTLRYYDAITSGDVSTIIDATNVLLNCQHNGGWLFNKFVPQALMDSASGSPLFALAASAPYLYEFLMPKTEITKSDDASARTDSRVAATMTFVQHNRAPIGQPEYVSFRVNDTFNSLWMPWTPDNQALIQEYLTHA